MSEFFLIAEIKSAYGKEGYLSVISHSNYPERLFSLDEVYIDVFGGKKKFYIEVVKKQKQNYLIKLKNFNSNNEVDFLNGSKIYVDDENLIHLSDNEFFVHDIIGSQVFRNNVLIGIVKDVFTIPANDVYVIEENNGQELLIPSVKDFVEHFDSDNKILVLKAGDYPIYNDDED